MNVGDTLYFVPEESYRWDGYDIVVKAIGRRWATIDRNLRIDIKTLEADGKGYSSPGRAWPSREAYETHTAIRAAWQDMAGRINRWHAPKGMTLERIAEIKALMEDRLE